MEILPPPNRSSQTLEEEGDSYKFFGGGSAENDFSWTSEPSEQGQITSLGALRLKQRRQDWHPLQTGERSTKRGTFPLDSSPTLAGFNEQWDQSKSMSIDARILEVTDETVKLECLMSKTKREFQERVFPKALLEGVVDLEVGRYVLLRILQRPGKIAHVFHNGDGIVQEEVFEDTSRFDDLEDMDLDRMA